MWHPETLTQQSTSDSLDMFMYKPQLNRVKKHVLKWRIKSYPHHTSNLDQLGHIQLQYYIINTVNVIALDQMKC